VDGELITLRGEVLAGLDYPGPASGLPGVWRRIEAEAAAVLGGTTLATLLPATTDEDEHAPGKQPSNKHAAGEHLTRQGAA
jgi:hypothetical protein